MRILCILIAFLFLIAVLSDFSVEAKTTKKRTTPKKTTKKKTTAKKTTPKKPTVVTTKRDTSSKKDPQSTNIRPSPRPRPQDELDSGLKGIHDRGRKRLPRNVTRDRSNLKSNMRQTSSDAYYINELATYAFDIVQNSTSARSTDSLVIDSQYCPFVSLTCDSTYKYRLINGSCNNLKNPLYGSSNTPYKRVLDPAYGDGFNSARTKAVSGNTLPHPRTISLKISPPPSNSILENEVSQIFATFGQFLIHDLSGTSASTDSEGVEIGCSCGSTDSSCLSLDWPANDPILTQQTCMEFTRSSASFPDFNCSVSYREQLNLLSSYIDGSAIYGIDDERATELRSFTGGQLKTSEATDNNKVVTNGTYLPLSGDTCSSSTTKNYKCFLAGEYRTSENLALVSMHTLFNREHNRIAKILGTNNPSWSDESLYQETRKIVNGMLQHIVYNEWLPLVINDTSLSPDMTKTQYYTGYDSSVSF